MPDDFSADISTTGVVAIGGSASGILEAPGDADWFKVYLSASTIYLLELHGAASGAGTLGSGYDTAYLRLYSASGRLIDSSIRGGPSGDPAMAFTPSISGYYYLSAAELSNDGVGTYKIAVSTGYTDDYSATLSTTGSVPVGGSVTGSIELPNDEDWFRVSLNAGTVYLLQLEGADSGGGTLGGTGYETPYLRLYSASGSLIQSTIGGLPSGDPAMAFTPATTGSYYLSASGLHDSGTGSYKISVTGGHADDFRASTSTSGAVPVEGSATGVLELPHDADWFRTSLSSGTAYLITLEGLASGAGTLGGTLATPYLNIYSASGSFIDSAIDGLHSGDPALLFLPSSTGNVYVSAEELYDEGTGTYRVSVLRIGSAVQLKTGSDADDALSGTSSAEVFLGGGGNDTLIGGGGLDTAAYGGPIADFTIGRSPAGLEVLDVSGHEGIDTLTGIERLRFTDAGVAFDLDGAAGKTAKLIGAIFGEQYLIPEFVGIGISYFDSGWSTLEVAQLALNTGLYAELAGSRGNADFVRLVYKNVVGSEPSAYEQTHYQGFLDRGDMSQAQLAVFAAETAENAINIDLIGMSNTGVEFTPFGG